MNWLPKRVDGIGSLKDRSGDEATNGRPLALPQTNCPATKPDAHAH